MLSVVVPLFNEAEGVVRFAQDLRVVIDQLGINYEVLFVDDGSRDGTAVIANSLEWPELRILVLARNVGHQNALDAGLSVARGKWVVTMDGDGQHPPDLIPSMLDAARKLDVDVVYTTRPTRSSDGFGKRSAALMYYRIMRWLTGVPIENSQADFRLMSERVLEEIRRIPGDRVLRLLLPAIGFRSTTVTYDALPRIAGSGRFGVRRQLRLAWMSVLDFSSKPLRFVASWGIVVSLAAGIWLAYVVVSFLLGHAVEGWASVISAVLIVGGLSLLSLSIIGAYVARVHDLLKAYPPYFVERELHRSPPHASEPPDDRQTSF